MEEFDDEMSVAKHWCETRVKFETLTYKWTITNFSYCPEKLGEDLSSPSFSSGTSKELEWCLQLYPKGCDKESKNYVSIYLSLTSGSKSKVKARFRFSICNAEQKETKSMKSRAARRFDISDWGFRKFVRRKILLNKKNNLLPYDKLTIFCEINIATDNVHISGKLNCKVPQYRLADDMARLFESKMFSDVTLSAGGHEFQAHKAILAARSCVFSAMFKHNLEERKNSRVEIDDLDQEVLQETLQFIYTGKISNLDEMADKLLAAADKYALERLKVMCEERLSWNLTIENAADMLILADMHSAYQLKAKVIEFIMVNASNVMKTPAWKTMAQSHPHFINDMFQVVARQHHMEPESKRLKRN